jgi:hypothetical protein
MGKNRSRGIHRQTTDGSSAVIDLLLQLEPELKHLQGNIVILQALGSTTDSVEPIALAALAHSCDASFDRVMERWRASLIAALP